MKTNYCYPAIMQKDGEGYSIWIPDIDGCNSFGETINEALVQIEEALGLCIEVMSEQGKPIPEPSFPERIQIKEGQFIAVVHFNWLEYQKKYCSKAMKKTLTIPTYLNDLAVKEHINFSAVLQEALIQKLNLY